MKLFAASVAFLAVLFAVSAQGQQQDQTYPRSLGLRGGGNKNKKIRASGYKNTILNKDNKKMMKKKMMKKNMMKKNMMKKTKTMERKKNPQDQVYDFEFLEATREVIPNVEVPKEEAAAVFDIVANDYSVLGKSANASEVWKKLPLPPDDYPDLLKGVLWMDQFGDYGYENISAVATGANESLLTFGYSHVSPLHTETRMMWHGGVCAGFVLGSIFKDAPPPLIYELVCSAGNSPKLYQFVWNEDYTVGNIYSYNSTGDLIGNDNGRFTLVKVPEQPEGTCPPPEDATQKERNMCAKFIRVSYGTSGNGFIYPVFEVVNNDGTPREPYYSAYLDAMKKRYAGEQYYRPLKSDAGDGEGDEEAN